MNLLLDGGKECRLRVSGALVWLLKTSRMVLPGLAEISSLLLLLLSSFALFLLRRASLGHTTLTRLSSSLSGNQQKSFKNLNLNNLNFKKFVNLYVIFYKQNSTVYFIKLLNCFFKVIKI
jgi:hypothetical protein